MTGAPGPARRDRWYDEDDDSPRRSAGCIALAVGAVVVLFIGGAFAVKIWPAAQNAAGTPSAATHGTQTPAVSAAAAQHDTTGFHATAPSDAGDAEQLAGDFLQAWSAGSLTTAANLTDDPDAAQSALAAYGHDLNLKKLAGTVVTAAGTAQSETVTFSLGATVAISPAAGAATGTWTYHSALTAYQVPGGTGWLIRWQRDLLAPNLQDGQHLAAVLAQPAGTTATDNAGTPLTSYGDAGLSTIAGLLGQHTPTKAVTPGLTVQIEDAAGKPVPGSQAVVSQPDPGQVATTITGQAERAARTAVGMSDGSAMVVLQPSSGAILAVANNAQDNDFALTAQVAPGSTMKIITASALLDSAVLTENSPVACPAAYLVTGITYHNDNGESMPPTTAFSYDFATSCNNAFDQFWPQLNGQLAATAQTYYGLNQQWNIGISGQTASYFSAPASASGSELAEEAFGEGQLLASPLAMASVAATVDTGQFHQPAMVAGTPVVSASPLPARTDQQLKDMMRDVVTEGTAEGLGLGPDVYAKTGTADVAEQDKPNSWMIAFDPGQDIAVASLVLNAGNGATVAGAEVSTFLGRY